MNTSMPALHAQRDTVRSHYHRPEDYAAALRETKIKVQQHAARRGLDVLTAAIELATNAEQSRHCPPMLWMSLIAAGLELAEQCGQNDERNNLETSS